MCKITKDIKLCTCKPNATRNLPHYWKLVSIDPSTYEKIEIIGEPAFELRDKISFKEKEFIQKMILKELNNYQIFDFDYSPMLGDELFLHFTVDIDSKDILVPETLEYNFIYENSRWKVDCGGFLRDGKITKELRGKIDNINF